MSLNFKLKLERIPVTLEDENGQEKEYYIREMDGRQRDEFMKLVRARIKIQEGKPVPDKFDGVEIGLLALTLYDANTNKTVKKEFIQNLPWRVVEKLAKASNKLSETDDEEEAEAAAGND